MAMRGEMLGRGCVNGRGQGRVFHNLDSTTSLLFLPDKGSDQTILVQRSQVRFIKSKQDRRVTT